MTYLTEPFLQKPSSRSHFLSLASISLLLIVFQARPASAQWTNGNANDIYKTTSSGNVGIGTSSPGAKLHVYNASGARAAVLMLGENINNIGEGGAIFEVNTAGVGTLYINAYKPGVAYGNTVIQSEGGNVGIGMTNPGAKLDVSGNVNVTGSITVSGNINAKFQDVAEWVPTSEHISTGTVVVLDSTKSNHVISSTRGYDTRVAGVISAHPGIALGESGNGKVLVATSGRVRIKVDATRSPIHVGDLLVTSNVPGLAMKSEPVTIGGVRLHRPGTLIGKALEPLAKGKGEILVLLSLQ